MSDDNFPIPKGYGQFCPVSRAAEVLAERWTPIIVRELLCGSHRFNELQQGAPRMSSALLSRRLKELEYHGVIERRPMEHGRGSEYHLTQSGHNLLPIIEAMGEWAQRWQSSELTEDKNLDPELLMWDVRRRAVIEELPAHKRYTTLFQMEGMPSNQRNYWLVCKEGKADVCTKDPGHDVDLYVSAKLRTLIQIWLGHISIAQARREETLILDGDKNDVAAFPSWFVLSLTARFALSPP